MKTQNYILLIIILFLSNLIFAEEYKESDNFVENNNKNFSVGINLEPYYQAVGPRIGYKINDYLGFHAIFQYSNSSADNIQYEKLYLKEVMHKELTDYYYKNLFGEFVLDIYPLENEIKASCGVGYMDKKFTHKKKSDAIIWNKTKFFAMISAGYEGFLLEDQGIKFELYAGVKFMDITLENESIKVKESQWKVIPTVNLAFSYAF